MVSYQAESGWLEHEAPLFGILMKKQRLLVQVMEEIISFVRANKSLVEN